MSGLCSQCGHTRDWHRTADEECTHEIQDPANDGWMRCNCKSWRD
jgi:hypothetical protein